MTTARITSLGDSCLSIAYEEQIDPGVNDRCLSLAAALRPRLPSGIRDIVPGFNSVAVYFDPLRIPREVLTLEIQRAEAAGPPARARGEEAMVEIEVRYGGDDGPDLSEVAAFAGCSEPEVVQIHSGVVYRVYMLGFLPGFAYLASVDRRLAMPRREMPRLKVRAGSVAIAGVQTAVYPIDSPGGWRIIGRTDARMFDPSRAHPSLLKPGQHVRFVAV